jgi:hypothetical protein
MTWRPESKDRTWEVLQEETFEHLAAGHRGLTPTGRGEGDGNHIRNLVAPTGKLERLEVPRGREGGIAPTSLEASSCISRRN